MTTSVPSRARGREWVGLAALVIPALLASMDLSILFMAAPLISAELGPTAGQHLWIVDIYGFVMAGLLVTMGSLGDRIGRRRLLLIGAAAFGAASLLAAFATTPELLIAARALLGLGGATLAPSTLALIRGMFADENQRRIAIGVWTAGFTGGIAIGPIIGGFLLERFWWGSVFVVNVPVMLLLLVVGPLLLPESKDPNPGRFDPFSSLLSLGAILPVIYAVKHLAEAGPNASSLVAFLAGLAVGALFVRRQRRSEQPMIDVRLFSTGAFSAAIGANTAITFASAGMGLLAVTFMQTVLGLSPFDAALWTLPTILGSVVGVALASALAPRTRPAVLVSTGLVLAAAGFLLVSTMRVDSPVWWLIASYGLLTLGVGMTSTLATSLVLTTAPPERAGAASALSETSTEFGGALGIAVLGSIAAGIYRAEMDAGTPVGLDDGLADAAVDTVGGALAVAGQLPAELADALLERAFAAFTDGFTVTAVVGAVILLAGAVASGVALRRVAAGTTPAD
ncbi:MFS transporter [Micromonospora sp. C28SCA-DRY-2]|uniref:MFS transporter n=1 Tax=Micromonospora sp. C28SCA-DRY-2 TaxID=3059522 RepID=UPI0026749466|nr:MFS transporter [Micromonospora sp. C28SCA-DRY-2]MDO3704620.1 MFS transporter [Micromonospora sp. C28SCA-DRY-2]